MAAAPIRKPANLFTLGVCGTMGATAPAAERDHILDVALPRRLKQISDDCAAQRLDVIPSLGAIRITLKGNQEGAVQGAEKFEQSTSLRLDKQKDHVLKVDGKAMRLATLQVQYAVGVGAYAGVLVPYNTAFSYADIHDALRWSLRQGKDSYYQMLFSGMAPGKVELLTKKESEEFAKSEAMSAGETKLAAAAAVTGAETIGVICLRGHEWTYTGPAPVVKMLGKVKALNQCTVQLPCKKCGKAVGHKAS